MAVDHVLFWHLLSSACFAAGRIVQIIFRRLFGGRFDISNSECASWRLVGNQTFAPESQERGEGFLCAFVLEIRRVLFSRESLSVYFFVSIFDQQRRGGKPGVNGQRCLLCTAEGE